VYPAGEPAIPGVTSHALVDALRAYGHRNVSLVEHRAELAQAIAPKLKEGDIVLTLGAGDITQVGPELLRLLVPEEQDADGAARDA